MRPLIPASALALLAAFSVSGCNTLQRVMPDRAPSLLPAPLPTLAGGEARAEITDRSGRTVGGAVFAPSPNGVLLRLEARGLTPGWHGMHLHAKGDCSDPAFQNAGAHVKHAGQSQHGLSNPQGPEAGDLPNLWVDGSGRASVELFSGLASLRGGAGDRQVLLDGDGSALVIHAAPDDHRTQPIGGSGDRVACGVIRPAL